MEAEKITVPHFPRDKNGSCELKEKAAEATQRRP
jgi:hypothetical protein